MKPLLLLIALLLPWPAAALPPPGAEAPVSAEINPLEVIDRLEALAERHAVPEVAALAARLATAEAALAFVREHVRSQAYPGVMRGARGALLARGGNAKDRALLLAALLEAQGARHRFASADLTAAQAARRCWRRCWRRAALPRAGRPLRPRRRRPGRGGCGAAEPGRP